MVLCIVLALPTVAAIVAFFLFIAFLYFTDCDLVLAYYERFGKKPECLAGKVFWVTGASSGIGKGLALKLASLKCRVVISARREDLLHKVKAECLASGAAENDIFVLPLDMVDYDSHEKSIKEVLEKFGQIDCLINNAGVSQRAMFEKVDLAVDRQLFDINVFSVVGLSTRLLNYFLENNRKGHIAVVSSIAGKAGVSGSRSYTGSKHALHGYFECLRIEKGSQIDVTMICPGPVFSEILKSAVTDKLNEKCGQDFDSKDKRMSAERCAELSVIAIANKLGEVWVSNQPVLISFYLWQYLPGLTRWAMQKIGHERLMKLRDGRDVTK